MSDNSLSPDDAREYLRRWAAVEERVRKEQASATLEQKLDELEMLMLSVDDFGWAEALNDDTVVRARWARLRERLLPAATSI